MAMIYEISLLAPSSKADLHDVSFSFPRSWIFSPSGLCYFSSLPVGGVGFPSEYPRATSSISGEVPAAFRQAERAQRRSLASGNLQAGPRRLLLPMRTPGRPLFFRPPPHHFVGPLFVSFTLTPSRQARDVLLSFLSVSPLFPTGFSFNLVPLRRGFFRFQTAR